MSKSNNYDTKSSILSIDYKIPYDLDETSRIVQHLEQSQQQLEFLKTKLTQSYEKVEAEMKLNIELAYKNEQVMQKIYRVEQSWEMQKQENKKLKEVMQVMLENRKILEQEIQYTHRRYKKIISQKEQQNLIQIEDHSREVKKLQKQISVLQKQVSIQDMNKHLLKENCQLKHELELSQSQIQALEHQIQKLTAQKVAEISRLKLQIQCYQQNFSKLQPAKDIQTEGNKENLNSQSTVVETTISDSKASTSSVGKWKKHTNQLTNDQKLTNCQLQKKKIENQLVKLERLKRHTQSDRQLMSDLEHQIYQVDSQISRLKRRIRQNY